MEGKAECDLGQFFDVMEGAISGGDSILKRGISALDYYLAMLTEWPTDQAALIEARPKTKALYASVAQRPA